MGIDFKRPRHIRGFRFGEVLVWDFVSKPLVEKTVSGSIVTFSDGSDEVGAKSCVVTVSPTLSGVSSVTESQTGRNLFDKATVIDNTWIVVNDTTTESAVGYRTSGYIPVKANTKYFVSAKSSNRFAYYDRNKNGIAYFPCSGGASFTCLYDGYIRITIKNDVDLDTFIVNEGNTAITYEPYNGTTYTANLGRTIYGGTADIVNGTGQETYGLQTFDGTETWTLYETSFWYTSKPQTNVKSVHPCVTSNGIKITYTTTGQIRCYISENTGVVDASTNMNALLSNGVSFNYQLNDNIDFTFDGQEVPTRLGYNAFWSDEGDTELTYYADQSLISQNQNRSLQTLFTPVEEETEEVVEGEQDMR